MAALFARALPRVLFARALPRVLMTRQGETMLEITGIGGVILLILDVWAIVSVIGSAQSTGKKVLWVLLVLLLPLLGFLIWLLAGPRAP